MDQLPCRCCKGRNVNRHFPLPLVPGEGKEVVMSFKAANNKRKVCIYEKTVLILTASALILTFTGASVFASENQNGFFENRHFPESGTVGADFERREQMQQLTDEQKAEMPEKIKSELSEKPSAGEITEEQYNELIEKAENGEMPRLGQGNGQQGRPQGGFGCNGGRQGRPQGDFGGRSKNGR